MVKLTERYRGGNGAGEDNVPQQTKQYKAL